MTPLPLVSVLIPTYNRVSDLEIALNHITELKYSEIDVIVIDDASTTSVVERLVAQYKNIRYERLSENQGLIGARNIGLRLCRGKYVLNLDDDSWLVDPMALTKAILFLESNPSIGILALNVQTKTGFTWRCDLPRFVVPYYTGCGNIYRRDEVLAAGECVREFVRQGEEMDRSIRVMNTGYAIVACPDLVVFHAESPQNRNRIRHQTFEAVNYFRREMLRAPLLLIPYGIFRASIFSLIRLGSIDWKLFGAELMVGSRRWLSLVKSYRSPVKVSTYLEWNRLAWQYALKRRKDCVAYSRKNKFAVIDDR